MQQFDVLLKIFGKAIFEAVETKGGCLVKEANLRLKMFLEVKKQLTFQLCSYVLYSQTWQ